MVGLKRYKIAGYKLIKENEGRIRVELNNNPFSTVIADKVTVLGMSGKPNKEIDINIVSNGKTTEVIIRDPNKR